ncbi:hypothetical protein H4Q26_003800 [Puccinia striiformis f. sp. tritici PST-130]|nr:hypothetical protein H4Q26_003800 [Puccinia striiformis f. sp. tritici PST-130]
MGVNRQRDAVGRPAAKSRRAISFAAAEGIRLISFCKLIAWQSTRTKRTKSQRLMPHIQKIVVDCRFGYEYEGGHIRAAINIHDKTNVDKMLLQGEVFARGQRDVPLPSESGKMDSAGQGKKVVVVFHCEYSAMRAPTIAKYLREQDRHMNMTHYPALYYPEVYILEGGYARYFAHSPQNCDGTYVKWTIQAIGAIDMRTLINSARGRALSSRGPRASPTARARRCQRTGHPEKAHVPPHSCALRIPQTARHLRSEEWKRRVLSVFEDRRGRRRRLRRSSR